MGIEKLKTDVMSITAKRMIGKPNQFGSIRFGWSEFGDYNNSAGVYRIWKKDGMKRQEKLDFYDMYFHEVPASTANNLRFGNAVRAWATLSDAQKKVYNDMAKGKPKVGINLFIAEYIRTH